MPENFSPHSYRSYRSKWDLPMLILLYLVGVINGLIVAGYLT